MIVPSTKALVALRAVAAFGGVRAAATELAQSQSAISHQLNALETQLGVTLLERRGRGLALTDAGRAFLHRIEPALEGIDRATRDIVEIDSRSVFTIAAPPAFLMSWLLPRLPDIQQELSSYSIRLQQALTVARDVRGIDLAIEYRTAPQPDADSELLMHNDVNVFAAPDLVRRLDLSQPNDLLRAPLIETEQRLVSWRDVLPEVADRPEQVVLRVPYSHLALESARSGYGVALANKVNAAHHLAAGDLCTPFALSYEAAEALPNYFATIPGGVERRGPSKAIRRWITGRIGRS